MLICYEHSWWGKNQVVFVLLPKLAQGVIPDHLNGQKLWWEEGVRKSGFFLRFWNAEDTQEVSIQWRQEVWLQKVPMRKEKPIKCEVVSREKEKRCWTIGADEGKNHGSWDEEQTARGGKYYFERTVELIEM